MNTSDRFVELMACFRTAAVGHCSIVDSDTYWEGERWTETQPNGDSMTIGGMIIPMHTQFLLCKEHEPKGSHHG